MARPNKIGLDYFPLDVNIDDTLKLIEAEHHLIGFAVVIKLWQKIYSNGYYIKWDEDTKLLFSRELNTELTVINSVVNSCLRRDLFNKNMSENHNILTSSGVQKRYILAASQSKRKNIEFITEFTLVNSDYTKLITGFSTQRKVKKRKVDEIEYVYSQFYDEQLELSENNQNYLLLIKWLFGDNIYKRPLEKVLNMKEQLSWKQFDSLLEIHKTTGLKIRTLLEELENWLMKNPKAKNSTVLGTLRTFAKRSTDKK